MTNYELEYRGVVCIAAYWETTPYKFAFFYNERIYMFEQKRDIRQCADTDHIRCAIDQFLEDVGCDTIICNAKKRKNKLESEENKMKYKVGDKVRIVSKWGKGCNQNPDGKMDKWLGKNMTIRAIYYGCAYKMKEDAAECRGNGWVWNENCIEGLACEKKIVITSDGEKTLARLYDGKKVVKTATAKCSPEDKFDFETGATIAFDRLFEKCEKKEEPKYFSGKVVCVDEYLGFTVGKIYEFVNGQCFDDQKMLRPSCRKCEDLEFFEDAFIPLVE